MPWSLRFALPLGLLVLLWSEAAFASVTTYDVALPAGIATTLTLDQPASAISVRLPTRGSVDMQVQEDGQWTDWQTLAADTDASPLERESQLVLTDAVRAVRLRSSKAAAVALHSITVSDAPIAVNVVDARRLPVNTIIPRWQWGADESLRVSKKGAQRSVERVEESEISIADGIRNCDLRARLYPEEFMEKNPKFVDGKGQSLLWPQGYSPEVHLFIIHHTAESRAGTAKKSGLERMRMLYAYHAVSRGWGDIGYNFVVDPDGNIYEGRAGGPFVVGAHAYCNNVGTIGIALMGNFQDQEPPKAQLLGLRMLLMQLSNEYGIDPTGHMIHHGKLLPTIIGHRDVRHTACPGNLSYVLFPQIRLAVKERDLATPLYSPVVVASHAHEATLLSGPSGPLTLNMGERQTLFLKYKNTGSDIWNGNSWMLGEADRGLYFAQFLPYSFVAGFLQEKEVEPGETGTFAVKVQGGLANGEGSLTLSPVINNVRRLALDAAKEKFRIAEGSPRYTLVTSYFSALHTTGEDLTGTVKLLNAGSVYWEKGTVTEIALSLGGGNGDVTILNAPESVGPGEQGSFLVRLQNIDEEGSYTRTLTPHFIDGSSLVGSLVSIASRAEPLPAIAFASSTTDIAASASSIRQGKISTSEDATIEAIEGTTFTLKPRQQVSIPVRIRAGKRGIAKTQAIAPVILSDPEITLRDDETGTRVRDVFKAPASLRAFQTFETKLTLLAPGRTGDFTLSIGDITFEVAVIPSSQYALRAGPVRKVRPGTVLPEGKASARRAARLRSAPLAPPALSHLPHIRVRLSNEKSAAILVAPSSMQIEGGARIFGTKGPVQVSIQDTLCKVSSADGDLIAPVIRIETADPRSFLMIANLGRSANMFRGTLECRVIDGALAWINDLLLEDYLAGLAEEPDSEPFEKQRAFAIAARSYALYYALSGQRKFPGKPYDGSDSPREFQAYGGVSFEQKNPRWVEAVRSTTGKVLTWERKIVKAPYFSSDDGRTKSAQDVWGWTHTPYLDAKDDPWCKGQANAGHGVGMSGCGAEGQANEGKTAEDILDYYYPGARILPVSTLE